MANAFNLLTETRGAVMLSAKKEYNLPERIDLGRKFSSVMGHFVSNLRESQVPHESYIDGEQYDLSEGCRKVCGYIAPPFQRPLEWTDQQKIRFIESAFMGLNLGTVTIHEASCNNVKNLSLIKATPFSGWIIDGQQRLSAIEAFLTDQIEVYGAYWPIGRT